MNLGMTLRQYLLFMIIATVLCWSAWLFVVFSMRPDVGGVLAMLLFYITFFCGASGTFSIVGLVIRRFWKPDEFVARHVVTAFRQSLFLSLLVVAVLIVQHGGRLHWGAFFLIIIAATLLEFLWLTLRRRREPLRAVTGHH